ncbi:hypothetical protein D3C79_729030 [compost metagenome]
MGDGALGLAPDFRAGADIVGFGIVTVAKLIEHQATAIGLQTVGEVASALHALFLADQNQLGAIGGHRRFAFGAGVVGHDQDHLVTLDRRRHGQGDPGVARGRFDQGVARLDLSAQFGTGDHRQRRPVLDRTCRVVAFKLEQEGVAGFTGNALQADQRRVADAIGDGWVLQGHGVVRNPDCGGAYHTGKRALPISRNVRVLYLPVINSCPMAKQRAAGCSAASPARCSAPTGVRPGARWHCGRCSGRGRNHHRPVVSRPAG